MRIVEVNKKIESIALGCLAVIKNYCEYSNNLAISKSPTSDFVYQITGGFESRALSKDETIQVVNFFNNYWITFKLFFGINEISNKQYEYFIYEVYIKLFFGENSNINKKLLFRAEWSSNNSGIYEHSQPHWHFHPNEVFLISKFEDYQSFLKLKEEEKDLFNITDNENDSTYDITKFHFSMTNEWHNGKSRSHIINLDENNITQWLDGLLNHIKNQLMYCDNKSY